MAGRIMSMKNCIEIIGNRTWDLLTCSTMPQPTVPPRALVWQHYVKFKKKKCFEKSMGGNKSKEAVHVGHVLVRHSGLQLMQSMYLEF